MSSCVFAVSHVVFFFFLMIRRPPRSTLSSSSAASDVYKRQTQNGKHKDVVDDHDNDGSDDKLQGASQDSYASLLFTLQGALLRNSPESLVGAVGDTSHHPTFIAVRLLTTIYYRHYLPSEALRSSPSTLRSFHSNSPALLKNAIASKAHQFVNRVYVPAMVGGSGADVLRYLRAHRNESLNDPDKDALLYIKPGGKTSAAGSGDCTIM
eukprot:TRINITY_DN12233_c0_g1_i1.p1 TRINITY_DN12233_c0_g1~~TRINITY_DN12233_c0_g1_i1.p1  ORF type:complete len:209 (+),score=48.29 TRINITY_DN12233_c0_g1_i1:66-692(+)